MVTVQPWTKGGGEGGGALEEGLAPALGVALAEGGGAGAAHLSARTRCEDSSVTSTPPAPSAQMP